MREMLLSGDRRWELARVGVLVAISFAVRLALYLYRPYPQQFPFRGIDDKWYYQYGQAIARGEDWRAIPWCYGNTIDGLPMGYPLAIASLLVASDYSTNSLFLAQIVLNSLATFPLYLATRQISGPTTAFLAVLVCYAAYPPVAVFASMVFTEAIFVPLLAILCYLVPVALRPHARPGAAMALGFVAAYCALTRAAALGIPVAVLGLGLLRWWRRPAMLLALVAGLALPPATAAAVRLTIVGTLERVGAPQGGGILKAKAFMLSRGFPAHPERIPWLYADPREAMEQFDAARRELYAGKHLTEWTNRDAAIWLLRHPRLLVVHWAANAWEFFRPRSGFHFAFNFSPSFGELLREGRWAVLVPKLALLSLDATILALACWGVVLTLKQRSTTTVGVLVLLAIVSGTYVLAHAIGRYRYGVMPLFAVMVARGLEGLAALKSEASVTLPEDSTSPHERRLLEEDEATRIGTGRPDERVAW